jgi:hypothetical protein
MTFFIVYAMGFLAVLALLWCFRGFTRELRQGRKQVGLLVQIVKVDTKDAARGSIGRNIKNVIELTRSQPRAVHMAPRRSTHVLKAQ